MVVLATVVASKAMQMPASFFSVPSTLAPPRGSHFFVSSCVLPHGDTPTPHPSTLGLLQSFLLAPFFSQHHIGEQNGLDHHNHHSSHNRHSQTAFGTYVLGFFFWVAYYRTDGNRGIGFF
jgi:hypothetical protein